MNTVPKEAFQFLKRLSKNNNREWFAENKTEFKSIELEMKTFYGEVADLMGKHDVLQSWRAYRIYRDIRFSKDKTPYKRHFAVEFTRKKPELRGGYYLHIEPENKSLIGVGFWEPNKVDVERVRREWEIDTDEIREILNNPHFKKEWGKMEGNQLKTNPKGFDKNHPDIDLINYKQWLFSHYFTDEEVLAPDFAENIDHLFRTIRPFLDYMSDVLTTDLNGVSLL